MGIPVKYKGEEREVGKGFLTGEFSGPEAGGKDLTFSAKAEERNYKEQVTLAALVSGDPVARNAAAAVAGGSLMLEQGKVLLEEEKRQKAKEEAEERLFLSLIESQRRAMDKYLQDLGDMAERLRQRIAENKAAIEANNLWIKEMEQRHKEAASALSDYEENGAFARGPDGKLKSKAAQKLLEDYEKRTGIKPESDTAIAWAIRKQMEHEEEEKTKRIFENAQKGEQVTKDEHSLDEVTKEAERVTEERKKLDLPQDTSEAERKIEQFWDGVKDRKVLLKASSQNIDDIHLQLEVTGVLKKNKAQEQLTLKNSEDTVKADADDFSKWMESEEITSGFNSAANKTPVIVEANLQSDKILKATEPNPIPKAQMS